MSGKTNSRRYFVGNQVSSTLWFTMKQILHKFTQVTPTQVRIVPNCAAPMVLVSCAGWKGKVLFIATRRPRTPWDARGEPSCAARCAPNRLTY